MSYLPSRRRVAQLALPLAVCAALAAGAARAGVGASATDDAMPLAFVQADPPPPDAPPHPDGMPSSPGPHMHPGAWEAARHAAAAARRGLWLADRLAAMHVYLDITPQQEEQWRAFSRAVLSMVPDPKEMTQDGPSAPGAFDGIDRMAKRMQRRAEAARALAEAAHTLKTVLTAPQIERADAMWAAMRMHRHAWHHHHHDNDDD